jgi:hypothetical protein
MRNDNQPDSMLARGKLEIANLGWLLVIGDTNQRIGAKKTASTVERKLKPFTVSPIFVKSAGDMRILARAKLARCNGGNRAQH